MSLPLTLTAPLPACCAAISLGTMATKAKAAAAQAAADDKRFALVMIVLPRTERAAGGRRASVFDARIAPFAVAVSRPSRMHRIVIRRAYPTHDVFPSLLVGEGGPE